MFNSAVPLLINFIVGVSVVNTKPGFIWRICVDVPFVSSLIIFFSVMLNCFVIVIDCRDSVSLYNISDISIEKFPFRVVYMYR